ncbi:VanZ like family protein [Terriglobus roseus]|uniref:VanZ like family protein n=1 Tax=Terriglobus roseus TaxID=392734 RepID=A0A1H4QNY8_9BACT|nr:VanZ like family protein [Terriglobus roseus]
MATTDTAAAPKTNQYAWIPVFCGIAVICMESTNKMGAVQTSIWLRELLRHFGQDNGGAVGLLNHYLRKGGHFTGYGLLGLFFTSGWFSVLRRKAVASWSSLRLRAGALGVASTLVIASADEIHQIFLPTRGASVWDVLLDTSGALTLNLIFFAYFAMRRNALLQPGPVTSLGLSIAGLPQRVSTSRPVRDLVSQSNRSVKAVTRTMRKRDLAHVHNGFHTCRVSFVSSRQTQEARLKPCLFLFRLAKQDQSVLDLRSQEIDTNITSVAAPAVSNHTSVTSPVRLGRKL